MAATDAFELRLPDKDDLEAADAAWADKLNLYGIPTGSTWYRVVTANSAAQALDFARACYAADKLHRFSPILVDGVIVPAAYAGHQPEVALWEMVLRSVRHEGNKRVMEKETRSRYLVETTLKRPLQLLDLRRPAIANIAAPGKRAPELSNAWPSAYDTTRAWAQELYSRLPGIDGFIYESHQIAGDCIILFQPANPDTFDTVGNAVPVSSEPVRSLLIREAKKAGAVVDFGDDPEPPDDD